MRMLVYLSATVILVALSAPSSAQDGHDPVDNVLSIPPSPTAASLGIFGDIPVGHFTGIPQITIPLFEIEGFDTSIPVTLSYHSSGIQVDDVAGWVGTGWAIQAGGVITRTVRGLPDDYIGGATNSYNYLTAGNILYGSEWDDADTGHALQGTDLFQHLGEVDLFQRDLQPDQYFINITGHSGRIFLRPDGTVLASPLQNLLVERNSQFYSGSGSSPQGVSSTANWNIVDQEGTRFVFSEHEVTRHEILSIDSQNPFELQYTSSWYLTDVYSPRSGNLDIVLEYTQLPGFALDVRPQSVSSIALPGTAACPRSPSTTHAKSHHHNTVLTRIESTTQGARFFSSMRGLGFDNPSEPRLDSIHVFNYRSTAVSTDTMLVHKFIFTYNNPGGDWKERLFLLSVQEFGIDGSLPAYEFEYASPGGLPGRLHPSVDHWGYPNSAVGNYPMVKFAKFGSSGEPLTIPGADRRASSANNGLLTTIIYPLGGRSSISYESNQVSHYGAGRVAPAGVIEDEFEGYQVTLTNPIVQVGGGTLVQSLNVSSNSEFQVELSVGICRNDDIECTEWDGTGLPPAIPIGGSGGPYTCDPYCAFAALRPAGGGTSILEFKDNGELSDAQQMLELSSYITVPAGQYELVVSADADTALYHFFATARANPAEYSFKEAIVGGARVARIEHYDGSSAYPVSSRSYRYVMEDASSSGFLYRVPQYHFIEGLVPPEGAPCAWITRHSSAVFGLGSSQGGPVGYLRVEEINDGEEGTGTTVHYYTASNTNLPSPSVSAVGPTAFWLEHGYDYRTGFNYRTEILNDQGRLLQRIVREQHVHEHVQGAEPLAQTIRGLMGSRRPEFAYSAMPWAYYTHRYELLIPWLAPAIERVTTFDVSD